MSTFTKTDEIRARGSGVDLGSCDGCRKASDMADLNQIAIDRLESSIGDLISHAKSLRKSRDSARLVAASIGFVAFLLLLGDLGVFKP